MIAGVELDGRPMDEVKAAKWQLKMLESEELNLLGPRAEPEVQVVARWGTSCC